MQVGGQNGSVSVTSVGGNVGTCEVKRSRCDRGRNAVSHISVGM